MKFCKHTWKIFENNQKQCAKQSQIRSIQISENIFFLKLIRLQTAQAATYLQVPYTTIPQGCRLLRQQPILQVPYMRVVSTRILHSKYFLPIVLKRNCTHSFASISRFVQIFYLQRFVYEGCRLLTQQPTCRFPKIPGLQIAQQQPTLQVPYMRIVALELRIIVPSGKSSEKRGALPHFAYMGKR